MFVRVNLTDDTESMRDSFNPGISLAIELSQFINTATFSDLLFFQLHLNSNCLLERPIDWSPRLITDTTLSAEWQYE